MGVLTSRAPLKNRNAGSKTTHGKKYKTYVYTKKVNFGSATMPRAKAAARGRSMFFLVVFGPVFAQPSAFFFVCFLFFVFCFFLQKAGKKIHKTKLRKQVSRNVGRRTQGKRNRCLHNFRFFYLVSKPLKKSVVVAKRGQ